MSEIAWNHIGETGRNYRRYGYDEAGKARMQFECSACRYWFEENVTPVAATESGKMLCDGPGSCAEKARTGSAGVQRIELKIPAEYQDAELDQIGSTMPKPERAALQKALALWPDKEPLIFLNGDTGRGKTYAAFAIQRALANAGRKVAYQDAPALRTRYIGAWQPGSRASIEKVFIGVPLLILDDVTRSPATEGWEAFLCNVIDARGSEKRPTLLISMATKKAIAETFCPALASRLAKFKGVAMTGPDRRVPVAKAKGDAA